MFLAQHHDHLQQVRALQARLAHPVRELIHLN
jgi:hypothetical protein